MADRPLILNSPKQRHGSEYEQKALQFLQAQGLRLVAQNWLQPKVGELDLVMIQPKMHHRGWDIVVFVEVRKRKVSQFGDALMSVTPAKQRKIVKTAHWFLQAYRTYAEMECRFDVVAFNEHNGVVQTEPTWLQGAFAGSAW